VIYDGNPMSVTLLNSKFLNAPYDDAKPIHMHKCP
jgi:hypothetical protein